EPLAQAIQRAALEQLDIAIAQLGGSAGKPDERATHETRKALKRLRAMLRLLRDELGEVVYTRESRALAGVAARLSETRDAEVLVETLDALVARHPRKLRRRGVAKLRRRLVAASRRARRRGVQDAHTRALALQELRALRSRVAMWELGCDREQLLEGGLRRIYRAGRRRQRRAERARPRDRDEALHEWRKRVKDLRYCSELLQRRSEELPAPGARATRLARVAARADELGELLGEDHDLALLAMTLKERSTRKATGRRTRRRVRKRIAQRRRKLRRRALRRGARLYRRPPRRFIGALRAGRAPLS
ncbi:MAG TPA: CHAD domain-containing protein, partial [Solirubrobacteraceae bacterium]|nr:CHAD domain-containing protein [Solirubrobacteraceae bacterium]